MCDLAHRQWFISAANGQIGSHGQSKAVPWAEGRQKDRHGHDRPIFIYPNRGQEAPESSWRVFPGLSIPAVILGTSPTLDVIGLSDMPELPTMGVNGIVRVFAPDLWFIATRDAWRENRGYVRRAVGIVVCNVVAWRQPMLRAGIVPMAMDMIELPSEALHSSAVFCAYLAHALGFFPVYLLGMDCRTVSGRDHFYRRESSIEQAPIEDIAKSTNSLLENSWVRPVVKVKDLPQGIARGREEIRKRLQPYLDFVHGIECVVKMCRDVSEKHGSNV